MRIQKSSEPPRPSKPWMRLTGAGLELAATMIFFGAVGWLFDNLLNTSRPIGMALMGLFGFAFAMFRFLRLALKVSEEQRAVEQRRRAGSGAEVSEPEDA